MNEKNLWSSVKKKKEKLRRKKERKKERWLERILKKRIEITKEKQQFHSYTGNFFFKRKPTCFLLRIITRCRAGCVSMRRFFIFIFIFFVFFMLKVSNIAYNFIHYHLMSSLFSFLLFFSLFSPLTAVCAPGVQQVALCSVETSRHENAFPPEGKTHFPSIDLLERLTQLWAPMSVERIADYTSTLASSLFVPVVTPQKHTHTHGN